MRTAALGLCAVLLVTVLAYAPVRSAGFVYEDAALTAMQWNGWAFELHALRTPAPRMLTNLTYRLQAGQHVGLWHLVNLGIHLVNGSLVWALLLPFGAFGAVAGSALWLLHPIQVESVAYISSRTDLLVACCVLLLLLATRLRGWMGVALVTLFGLLACAAKESAVVVIGLLPLWLIWRGAWARRWWIPLGVWAFGGLAVLYRLVHIPSCVDLPGSPCHYVASHWAAISLYTAPAAHGLFWTAAVQAAALWRLLALVVVPVGFTVDHDWDLVSQPVALVALVALVAVLVMAYRRRSSAWAFAGAWLVVAVAPRFVMSLPDALNEHQMSVPLLGACLACGVYGSRVLTGTPRSVCHG